MRDTLTLTDLRDAAVTLRAARVDLAPDPETDGIDISAQLADVLADLADRADNIDQDIVDFVLAQPEWAAMAVLVARIQSVTR